MQWLPLILNRKSDFFHLHYLFDLGFVLKFHFSFVI